MASLRRVRRRRCDGKRRYPDRDGQLIKQHKRNLELKEHCQFEIYHCQHCGSYHLGHEGGTGRIANKAKIEAGMTKGRRGAPKRRYA